MDLINVADLVEENGKTVRENNNAKQHAIPVGALVEIVSDDPDRSWYQQYRGVRVWVARHSRDCDGTPLYALSIRYPTEEWNNPLYDWEMSGGFGEDCLKVVEEARRG